MLASRSPQRRAILEQLGVRFRVEVPRVEEVAEGEPRAMVLENATRKARAVAGARVLGVDTTVSLAGRTLSKPIDEDEARAFLAALGGRTHEVWSGIVLREAAGERSAAAVTRVRFRALESAEIERYLATGEWRERAGGYAIQGAGAALIEAVEGDFWNVVGLPVAELVRLAPELLHEAPPRPSPGAVGWRTSGTRVWGERGPDLATEDLVADPLAQFQAWFEQSLAAGGQEANAMTLATVSPDGRPSARIVLLKGLDERGFSFFTNHRSEKGRDLAGNPHAALVFHWPALGRQVRVTGAVTAVPATESDRYFASRPRESRLAAIASPQSEPIESREALEQAVREAGARFPGESVPRPQWWGGLVLVPDSLEFWQSRPHRLHDRFRYRRAVDGGWQLERLAP